MKYPRTALVLLLLVSVTFLFAGCSTQKPVSVGDFDLVTSEWQGYRVSSSGNTDTATLKLTINSNTQEDLSCNVYDDGTENELIANSGLVSLSSGSEITWYGYNLVGVTERFPSENSKVKLCCWGVGQNEADKVCIQRNIKPVIVSFDVDPKIIQLGVASNCSVRSGVDTSEITVTNTGNVGIQLYRYGYSQHKIPNIKSDMSGFETVENSFYLQPGASKTFGVSSVITSGSCPEDIEEIYDQMVWGVAICPSNTGIVSGTPTCGPFQRINTPQQEVFVSTNCACAR